MGKKRWIIRRGNIELGRIRTNGERHISQGKKKGNSESRGKGKEKRLEQERDQERRKVEKKDVAAVL